MTDESITRVTEHQLVREVAECERYAFLIGAGCSKAGRADIPTGGELIDEWRETCYEQASPDAEFDKWVEHKEPESTGEEERPYGFWFEQMHPSRGGRREFIEDLVEDAKPNLGYILLATMMNEGYVPHVLTSNFDDLLFDAFYRFLEDRPNLIDHRAVAPEFKITRDRPAIVKLHGDYLYDNLQNTDDEMGLSSAMEEVLQQTVTEYGLVVVGYSGGDDSIMEPLLDEDLDLSEYGIYWCARNPDDLDSRVEELLQRENTYLVDIEGFVNLMAKFGNRIDDVELPDEKELINRAEDRADFVSGALDERKGKAQDEEEEEFLDKAQLIRKAIEAHQNESHQRASELWSDVIHLDPEFAEAYNARGSAKAHLGNHEEAIADYDRALDLDPEFAEAYYNRGLAEGKLGNHEEAIADFDRVLDLDPEHTKAYNNRGNAKDNLGNFKAAVADYDRVLDLDPEHTKAYNNRGNAKAHLGNLKAAIADYDQALDLDPKYVGAYLNRAETYIRMESFESARDDAQEARSVADSTEETAMSQLLELIAKICLGEDTESLDQEYKELCEEEFTASWRFEELDSWIDTADLPSEQRERIEELIDLLRAHKETN